MLAIMNQANARLRATGLKIAAEQIEFFIMGAGRPSSRIYQQPFRWVAGDPRRLADGDRITYLVDQSYGATAGGLTSAQTEAAIDCAYCGSAAPKRTFTRAWSFRTAAGGRHESGLCRIAPTVVPH